MGVHGKDESGKSEVSLCQPCSKLAHCYFMAAVALIPSAGRGACMRPVSDCVYAFSRNTSFTVFIRSRE